jgi:taurine dioxygenase
MNISTRPLAGTFGAEVLGVQLASQPDPATVATVRRLWAEHKLLLFRGQSTDEADLVGFSRALGDLEIHVRREFLSPQHPEILYVSNIRRDGRPIGILADNEVGWHYDQIYLPRPAVGSLLCAVMIPQDGGNTHFADMAAAYDALPAATRARIDGKRAVQSYEAFNRAYSVPTSDAQKRATPDIDQPVVRTHPVTGRRALYICPGMTTRIVGLPDGESESLLSELFEWAVRPEFIYSHAWRVGDCLLWDNACTMHRRDPFDARQERLMKRTTILPSSERAVPR